MSFKGFKRAKYPTKTIVTPQYGESYILRTLNVKEVLTLRDSLISPNKVSEVLNNMIWSTIESGPDCLKTKNDFLNHVSMSDRDALIYALYNLTFGNEKVYSLTCGDCLNTQKMKIFLDDIYFNNVYPGATSVKESYRVAKAVNPTINKDPLVEDIIAKDNMVIPPESIPVEVARNMMEYQEYFEWLDSKKKNVLQENLNEFLDQKLEEEITTEPNTSDEVNEDLEEEKEEDLENSVTDFTNIKDKIIRLPLKSTDGVVVYIRVPKLIDELNINKNLSFNTKLQIDLASETLSLDRIEELDENGKVIQTITDRIDIVEAYQFLPEEDRREINRTYYREFGQFRVNLKAKWNCRSCGEENNIFFEVMDQFFRALRS